VGHTSKDTHEWRALC